MKSAGLALIPLTLAERDREFLKQLRRYLYDLKITKVKLIENK